MKKSILTFMKKETVLLVATVLAVVSACIVPPDKTYMNYIDWRVLGILLTLMLIMAGLQKNGLFDAIGDFLLQRTKKLWQLVFVLVFLCFLFSMLITNDVALITFVPFSIMLLKKCEKEELLVYVVVLQTMAANLGSMLTPIGNPQNLYLYNLAGFSLSEFLLIMLPYTLVSAVLLLISMLFIREGGQEILVEKRSTALERQQIRKNVLYLILFVCAVLVVARVFPWKYVLLAAILLVIALDTSLILKVDYSLLLTFIAFFVFTGNMARIPQINAFLQQVVCERETVVAVLTSQVISNVPATLLLSGFTNDYRQLLIGVNLGGLGTLIASMASLISYKLFVNSYPQKKRRYFAVFTGISIIYLVILSSCKIFIKYL